MMWCSPPASTGNRLQGFPRSLPAWMIITVTIRSSSLSIELAPTWCPGWWQSTAGTWCLPSKNRVFSNPEKGLLQHEANEQMRTISPIHKCYEGWFLICFKHKTKKRIRCCSKGLRTLHWIKQLNWREQLNSVINHFSINDHNSSCKNSDHFINSLFF